MADSSILFLGAGNMGGAILRGLSTSGVPATQLGLVEPSAQAAQVLCSETGAQHFEDVESALQWADILLLCVKPQIFKNLEPLSTRIAKRDPQRPLLVISIMAGVSLAALRQWARASGNAPEVTCVRTMPNLPLTVGCGAVGVASDGLTEVQLQRVEALFAPVGTAVRVPESQLDAVTGLAGSGPAWVFQFIEGLVQAGVKSGLPRDTALKLTLATLQGSLEMVRQTGASPSDLTAMVCSPGGTTIHGLQALEEGRFRAVLMQAVDAATRRSQALGA